MQLTGLSHSLQDCEVDQHCVHVEQSNDMPITEKHDKEGKYIEHIFRTEFSLQFADHWICWPEIIMEH